MLVKASLGTAIIIKHKCVRAKLISIALSVDLRSVL